MADDAGRVSRAAALRGLAVLAVAGFVLFASGLIGMPRALAAPAAIVVLVIGLWATAALAEHLTALLMFAVVVIFDVVPPSVIFAGFAASAFWLVFGGLVIAASVERTGLGRRVAGIAARGLQGSYARVVLGVTAFSLGLAFLVPAAMGRVVLLIPLVRALAGSLGFGESSRGHVGLVLAAAVGTFVPAFAILPANIPNLVLLGGAETLHGLSFAYGRYLIIHFPVLGLAKAGLLVLLILWLFPDRPRARASLHDAEPWSAAERRLLALLGLALLLWASDFVHGVGPGWVALVAGLICLMPRVGFFDRRAFAGGIDLAPLFHVAGLLGVVSLIDGSGLAGWLGPTLLDPLPLRADAPAWNFAAVLGLASAVGLVTTLAGVPAVLTPLAQPIAAATGLPLLTVLMIQVVAFSAVLLPYQVPPLAVAIHLGRVPLADAVKLLLSLAFLTFLVLAPLQYGWWAWLGLLDRTVGA